MTTKKATSFRLSDAGMEILERLSSELGISQAAVVELSIRCLSRVWEQPLPVTRADVEGLRQEVKS